ncbi:MAG: hypothetical protein ACM3SR_00230 [Ignavibacteriales bacterium]
MKMATKLTFEMKVKKKGVVAKVTLNGDKKTYFFPFDATRNEASRIDQLIGYLPRNFYIDALLKHK